MTYHRGVGEIPDGVCWTCRRHPPTHEAVATDRPDAWLVCAYCRREGLRLAARIAYRPITDIGERVA